MSIYNPTEDWPAAQQVLALERAATQAKLERLDASIAELAIPVDDVDVAVALSEALYYAEQHMVAAWRANVETARFSAVDAECAKFDAKSKT
jgi:hypothetical protein